MSGTQGSIGGSGGGASASTDVEFQILCDNNAGINTRFLRRYTYDAGAVTVTDTELDGITAYTVTGQIIDCAPAADLQVECFVIIDTGIGYTNGDQILRLSSWDTTQVPAALASTVYFNRSTGAALTATPAPTLLRPCDSEYVSYTTCYKTLTDNAPYWLTGQILTVVRVEDVSNPTATLTAAIIYYNVDRGTGFTSNDATPLVGVDIEPCAGNSDNELVILCDNNAGTITRFLRRYVVLNGNVSTVDTTVDGQTAYAPAGTVQLCQPCGQIEVLCDDIGSFLRHYGCDGTTTDTALDGTTAYTVTGTVKRCDIKGATPIILCDDNGSFLRHLVYANDGLSATIYDTTFDGTTAYTAVGTVKRCDFAVAYQLLCDYSAGTVVPFLRRFAQAETGALAVTDTALDAVTAYTVAGTVGDCALANVDPVILCDDNGSFLRHVLYSGDGTTVTVFDTDMDGVDYTTVGTVKNCGASGRALIQACDKTTETTGNVPGACGTNQQTVDAVDIQDAEEKDVASGLEVNVNDNDLEMAGAAEAGESDHQIAVRFTMNVPQGATICNAYIQFTSRSTTSFGTLDATISAEAEDDSAPFVENNGELSARTKTAANVAWSVPLWPTSSQAGADQRTPDLSTIVQEIVDRPGWAAGNNTAFFFVPGATGYRRAKSITSGTAVAPKLHVEYVLDSPGGTKDVCVPFYKEIDLSTGLETGNSYRINETSGAWEAYTPTGTVSDGDCICAGTPGDGSTDFELLCMVDAANTKFIRVVAVDGASGAYKVVGDYALDFSGNYTPVGTVAPCADSFSSIDSEVVTLCDNNGAFLRHITYDANGAVQAVTNTALDGITAYTPVGTVKVCAASVTLDSRIANVAGTAAAAVTQAIAALVPGGKTMISLSISVLAGTASVTDSAGTVIAALPVGYSANWSSDTTGALNFPQSVTAAINSRVVLVYTLR